MIRPLITVGLWLAALCARAQSPVPPNSSLPVAIPHVQSGPGHATGTASDSLYVRQRIARTDVQALFAYYAQSGRHSAVTGGTGTEAPTVYAPGFSIRHERDTVSTLNFAGGIDVITSASTDRIDYRISSASRVDNRVHANLGYSRRLRGTRLTPGLQTGFSAESDYLSLPVGVSLAYKAPSGNQTLQAGVRRVPRNLRL